MNAERRFQNEPPPDELRDALLNAPRPDPSVESARIAREQWEGYKRHYVPLGRWGWLSRRGWRYLRADAQVWLFEARCALANAWRWWRGRA